MTSQGKNAIDVLLAESFKELAQTRPIEKITIKEITDRAGVIRPTFYNHFQDKYELLEWIVDKELIEPVLPFLNNGMVKEGITFVLTTIENEKSFYDKAVRLEGQNCFMEILKSSVSDVILSIMNTERLNAIAPYSWITSELVADFYAQSLCYACAEWIKTEMRVPINEIVDIYIHIIDRSVRETMKNLK